MRTSYLNANWSIAGIIAVLLAATALGCSWPWPYLQHNTAVERHFDGYQIYPQYQYYTAGTLDDPRAIVALKSGYTLDSPEWTAVSMTSETLEQWITALKKDPFVEDNELPNGANLVGRNKEVAGYYYSVWDFPAVRVAEEKTISMAVPLAEYRMTNRFYMEMHSNDGFGFGHFGH